MSLSHDTDASSSSPSHSPSLAPTSSSTECSRPPTASSESLELDTEPEHKATTLTAFASVTGFRASAITGTRNAVSINSHVLLQDLQDASDSIGVSPAAFCRAAWAFILSAYTDPKEEIAFLTISPHLNQDDSNKNSTEGISLDDCSICRCDPAQLKSDPVRSVLRELDKPSSKKYQQNDEPLGFAQLLSKDQNVTLLDLSTFLTQQLDLQSELGEIHNAVCIRIWPSPSGMLILNASFTDATLNENAASLMLKQLDYVLTFAIATPDESLKSLPLTPHLSLFAFSDQNPAILAGGSLLHSKFEQWAVSHPERIALDFRTNLEEAHSAKNASLTYRQLNEQAETLATHLLNRYGSLVNKAVPICMERCPELYIAILGILKAGGGWCPIDPSFPSRRRHDLIARAGAAMLITTTDNLDGVPENVTPINVTSLESPPAVPLGKPTLTGDDLAYLIWTSGTTGEPKGVPIDHQAAVTSMTSLQRCIPSDTKDGGPIRCLQFSQFTFDVFIQDLFYTWGLGGTLISSDRATMLGSFAKLTVTAKASHAHLTPAFAASVQRSQCPTLEVVTMIGEKLTEDVADDWGSNIRAFNTYGPAEATIVATLRQFGGPEDRTQSGNVGIPLPSVSVAVVRDGVPVMKGGTGELALGGPQLSKGYWHDAKRSANRFVWIETLCTKLYMTGDIVRMLHDDSLEFVGRDDDLVKIQGIRVELSEIAFSLRSCHPDVQQVDIQMLERPDRPSKVLIGFFAVPDLEVTDGEASTGDVAVEIARAALKHGHQQLPDYMIPRVYLVVNQIPRTTSNKVDRTALKNLYSSIDLGTWEAKLAPKHDTIDYIEGWSNEESHVIECITEISGTSAVAMNRASTLPSIGIDSIGATRLVTMLHTKGYDVSVAQMLLCQSLDQLFSLVQRPEQREIDVRNGFDDTAFNDQWLGVVKLYMSEFNGFVAPALPLQEALLSESLRNAETYWSHQCFHLDSDINLSRLRDAWGHVASDTDALRTSFVAKARLSNAPSTRAAFLQAIHDNAKADWTHVVSHEASFEEKARAKAHEIAVSHQRDYFQNPPWAVTIFSLETRHVMMLSTHHSIRDEPSLDFLMHDLDNAYTCNNTASLNRCQLHDALRMILPSDHQFDEDEKYWQDLLSKFVAPQETLSWPEMIIDRSLREPGFGALIWDSRIPYKELQSRAISIGASSVASLIRLAWTYLVLQYLETDRIVLGETWSSRSEASVLTDVVGPLISVVPFPFQLRESARESLHSLGQKHDRSKIHYGVHPQVIRKVLGRPEGQPLYPAIFNFVPDTNETTSEENAKLWHRIDDVVELSVEHPVALNASISGQKIQFELMASRGVMDQAHLQLISQQLDAIVETILEHPDESPDRLSVHIPRQVLSISPLETDLNANQSWDQSPTHWVDHFAHVHPQWSAAEVVSLLQEKEVISQQWTYQKLQRAYQHVAYIINQDGLSGRMIAVCVERKLDIYAVLLGILASGNTYLPIAEDLPEERKAFLLQDSKAAILFVSRSLTSSFTNLPKNCTMRQVEDLDYAHGATVQPSTSPQPIDNAYLLYTSGSTGVPKGVLVSRGNLASFIEAASKFMHAHVSGMEELQGVGRYLGLSSYAFDVHFKEMFAAWRHGMTTVTAPRATLIDNLELALRELRITHVSTVPSLVDSIGLAPNSLPDLRYISVGGEKISQRVIDTWSGDPRVTLNNAYGPTEATIGCSFKKVTPGSSVRNVGPPLAYVTAHVFVPNTTHYAIKGTAGELCLTGDLVTNGYYNRPEVEGFIEDFNGQRMYRTGDRVRLMADDSIEFLGRDDDQTKIRGQRLELGEVSEAVRAATASLLKVDSVDAAAIVAQHSSLAKPQLVVFLALKHTVNGERIHPTFLPNDGSVDSVKAMCERALPAYMVPDHVIPLTILPVAQVSRKVDLKRLKALFAEISLADLLPQAPTTDNAERKLSETEKEIAEVIVTTLGLQNPDIKPSTNLFQIGLDSLSAVSLTINLRKMGFECTVSSVLQRPLVQQLAGLPHRNSDEDAGSSVHAKLSELEERYRSNQKDGLLESNIAVIRPCLPLQETLIASSMDEAGEALYVNHIILGISHQVDQARLREAWESTIADHEILRTCFRTFEENRLQVILKESHSYWKEIPTPSAGDNVHALRQEMNHITREMIAQLRTDPPFRLTLAGSSSHDGEAYLMVSIHHALYDGESFPMLLDEVYSNYEGLSPSARTPFSTLISHVYSQSPEHASTFWKGYLDGYKPVAFDRQSNRNSTAEIHRTFKSPLSKVEELASSINGTPASLIQAIFGIVLAQHLGRLDVVFGTTYSGRTLPIKDPHTILAPCITTTPQRVTFQISHPDILDSIIAAQTGFLESLEYQHTALRDIHRWVKADRPLFDSLFSHARRRKPAPWLDLWSEFESAMPNEFPFAVETEADEEADSVSALCVFGPAFGDVDSAISFLESMDLLLEALVLKGVVTLKDLGIADSDNHHASPVYDEGNWSQEERQIREVVSRIAGLDESMITKGASFFSLGLDSISAIKFSKQLREQDMSCSSAQVMRHPCIAELASHISQSKPRDQAESEGTASVTNRMEDLHSLNPQDPITTIYPCTPLQSSMLTQTLGSEGTMYVHQNIRLLNSDIEIRKLKKAWRQLVLQTEILRTSFHLSTSGNKWLATVHESHDLAYAEWVKTTDVRVVIKRIQDDFRFQAASEFEKPPWRLDINGDYMILSLHHSLYDGDSLFTLFADLVRIYEGTDVPRRPPFSEAAKEITQISTNAENFWLRQLEGYHGTATLPKVKPMAEARHTMKIGTAKAIQGCKSLGVTLQTVALLAFGKGMMCTLGQRDMAFGHVVAGRSLSIPGIHDIVGPLFNTVPLRLSLDKMVSTNEGIARDIQDLTGKSQNFQHASLSRVQQIWQNSSGQTDNQLLNAIFLLQQTQKDTESQSLWETIDSTDGETPEATEYAINFEIEQGDEEIVLTLASRHIDDLPAWLDRYENVFDDILQHPKRSAIAYPEVLSILPLSVAADDGTKPTIPKEAAPGPDLTILQEALSQVAGINQDKVSHDTRLASLGLDSISAIQLASICRKKGLDVSVADVLQGTTVMGICERVRQKAQACADNAGSNRGLEVATPTSIISEAVRSEAMASAGIDAEDVEIVMPCLAGQVFHLMTCLKSGRTFGEASWIYQCKERIDAGGMESAWNSLRRRHPILRTVFVAINGAKALQIVLKPDSTQGGNSFKYEGTRSSEDGAKQAVMQIARRPFDIFTLPARLAVISQDKEDLVVMKLHHATYDALTIGALAQDLDALYKNEQLPPLPPTANFIASTIASQQSSAARTYWKHSLRNSQQTILHNTAPAETSSSPPLFYTQTTIPNLRALKSNSQTRGMTLPTAILIAFARTLATYTSTTNPTFGLYQAGRSGSFEGLAALPFPCLNVTPLTVHRALSIGVEDVARELQEDLAQRTQFEQSFLGDILGEIGWGGGRGALFNTYINILRSQSSTTTEKALDRNQVLKPYKPDDLMDFAPTERREGKTAVDNLDRNVIAEGNMFLDVMEEVAEVGDSGQEAEAGEEREENREGGKLRLVMRCDRDVMSEIAAERFIENVCREIKGISGM